MNHLPFLCINENRPEDGDAYIRSPIPIFDQRNKTNGAADGVVLLLQQDLVCCSSRALQEGLICVEGCNLQIRQGFTIIVEIVIHVALAHTSKICHPWNVLKVRC